MLASVSSDCGESLSYSPSLFHHRILAVFFICFALPNHSVFVCPPFDVRFQIASRLF